MIRSIGVRLTLYYAIAASGSAAILFGSGYLLLKNRLVGGLDDLNRIEFVQLQRVLGPDYLALSAKEIDERISKTANAAPAIFYIDVEEPRSGMIFSSQNLHKGSIPDVKGKHIYDAEIPGVGEVRVAEFIMPRFDVEIATPLSQARATMRSYAAISAGLLMLMLVASAGIGLGLSRVILKPLKFIRETAARIDSDNLSERIPVANARDELGELAGLLNRMFDRLEDSFEQIKRFSAEASHELKTPLSLIRLHGERLLERSQLPPEAIDAIVVQLEEVGRLNQIIDEMLFLSRAEANAIPVALKAVDPTAFLQGFAQDAQALAEFEGRSFQLSTSGDEFVAIEERWIRQVFLNLLTNSLAATQVGGSVQVESGFAHGHWQVTFTDDGPGVSEEDLPFLFDRFAQSGPPDRRMRGNGLGLAISRSIVKLHRGTIVAQNLKGRTGLVVTIRIPQGHATIT